MCGGDLSRVDGPVSLLSVHNIMQCWPVSHCDLHCDSNRLMCGLWCRHVSGCGDKPAVVQDMHNDVFGGVIHYGQLQFDDNGDVCWLFGRDLPGYGWGAKCVQGVWDEHVPGVDGTDSLFELHVNM